MLVRSSHLGREPADPAGGLPPVLGRQLDERGGQVAHRGDDGALKVWTPHRPPRRCAVGVGASIAEAMSERTRAILLNSPALPVNESGALGRSRSYARLLEFLVEQIRFAGVDYILIFDHVLSGKLLSVSDFLL